jgi:putative ABC transport system permease protein
MPVLDALLQDISYAARGFIRNPGFTAVAVLTLALGIGANTAIFSVVNAILLRPLPYEHSDHLVTFFKIPPSDGVLPLGELPAFRSRMRTLSHVAAYDSTQETLTGRGAPARLVGTRVSPSIFGMLGASPALGRVLDDSEERAGSARVVVLSHRCWRLFFDADPNLIGRRISLNGLGYEVAGVMPTGFQFPDAQTDFWTPLPVTGPGRGMRPVIIARLRQDSDLSAAAAELNLVLPGLQDQSSPSGDGSTNPRFGLMRLQDMIVSDVAPALWILTVAVAVVLLIACVNVANLLLERCAARQREIAIRRALGAGPLRLAGQFMTESLLLAIMGGIAGSFFAFGGVAILRVIGTSLPRRDLGMGMGIPRLEEVTIDGSVLLFALGVSLLTGVLFGLAPAVRQSGASLMDVLREGAGSAISGLPRLSRTRMQHVLIVSQVGMATVLLIGAGLLIHSLMNLYSVRPGYDPENVMTFQLFLPQAETKLNPLNIEFAENLVEQFASVPRVVSAGYALQLPMVRMQMIGGLRTSPSAPPDSGRSSPPPPGGTPESPDTRLVSQDFLKVMGIRILAGRGFTKDDRAGTPRVLLINETLARNGYLGDNPLGKHVYTGGDEPWEIVGIVDDVRQLSLRDGPGYQVFINVRQDRVPNAAPYFAVRTDGSPSSVIDGLRSIVHRFEPTAAIDNVATMQQLVSNSVSQPRFYTVLLAVFAGIAVLLAAIGVYGVVAYSVTQRTREIGIRMALGSRQSDVLLLVVREGLTLAGIGIMFGIGAGVVVTRYLDRLLFGIKPFDPITFIAVAGLFIFITAAAACIPAWRASKVDPLVSLRSQ